VVGNGTTQVQNKSKTEFTCNTYLVGNKAFVNGKEIKGWTFQYRVHFSTNNQRLREWHLLKSKEDCSELLFINATQLKCVTIYGLIKCTWDKLIFILLLFMLISILSINARGIRNQLKRKSLFLYCQSEGADFYFIQESHYCEADVTFCQKSVGEWCLFLIFTNKSAGVVILKGKYKGRIHSKQTDTEGRWIILHVSIDVSQFIIVNVYATNNKQKNNHLFLTIESKINQLCSKFPYALGWGL